MTAGVFLTRIVVGFGVSRRQARGFGGEDDARHRAFVGCFNSFTK